MKKSFLLIPFVLAASFAVKGQSVGPSIINAAGNHKNIAGNEFEWSVGEMTLVSTFTTPGIVVTQGTLQPSDIDHTGVPVNRLATQLKVFPNPATSVVNVEYTSQVSGTLSYDMLDVNGKVVAQQTMDVKPGTVTGQVNVSQLACATYMLRVTLNPENAAAETTTYKIQKLK